MQDVNLWVEGLLNEGGIFLAYAIYWVRQTNMVSPFPQAGLSFGQQRESNQRNRKIPFPLRQAQRKPPAAPMRRILHPPA